MADIESLGYPLVYKASVNTPAPTGLPVQDKNIAIRTKVCALTGMQKEAMVYYSPTGTTWRMVSDEGPYLNGTDLAPFPLAFFATGMVLSFATELLKHAKSAGVTFKRFQLTQDSFYTMEGSAIRGDMIGGALPVEILVEIESDVAEGTIREITTQAIKTSPAQKYMSQELVNTFSLTHNGQIVPVFDVAASPGEAQDDPTPELKAARPLKDSPFADDIIVKVKTAETIFGVEGGAGSSLQATQKRTLHVRSICTLREDGLKDVRVQLIKPLGSTFCFISDDTDMERAPSSLAYLAAGIGFCFMTQIGRYATIVKQDLKGYSIVQDTVYKIKADSSSAKPVDTHAFLQTGEDDKTAQKTLCMSERTCFLHAAMRGSNKTKFRVQLNDRFLEA